MALLKSVFLAGMFVTGLAAGAHEAEAGTFFTASGPGTFSLSEPDANDFTLTYSASETFTNGFYDGLFWRVNWVAPAGGHYNVSWSNAGYYPVDPQAGQTYFRGLYTQNDSNAGDYHYLYYYFDRKCCDRFDVNGSKNVYFAPGESADFVLWTYNGYPDNPTVSGTFSINLTLPSSVPEPGGWVLMLAGFGGLGAVMRASDRLLPRRGR